jgi:hypothetical protein
MTSKKKATKGQTALPVSTARSARSGKARKQLTKGNSNDRSLVQCSGDVIGPPVVGTLWTEPVAVEIECSVERGSNRTTQSLVLRASKRGLLILALAAILAYGAVTRDHGAVRRVIHAFADTVNGESTPKNGR